MEIEFLKMQAAGHDVILVELARHAGLLSQNLGAVSRSALNRHTGVGGESLLLLQRSTDGGLDLRAYTPAGREEEPALNDFICAGRYAIDSGLVSRTSTMASGPTRALRLEVLDSRSVTADLGAPRGEDGGEIKENPDASYTRTVSVDERDFTFTPVRMGPPQAVAFVPDFSFDIRRLSLGLDRATALAPNDTAQMRDPSAVTYARVNSRGRVSVRTWRYGHGEARSDGYAAGAVAVAAALHGFVDRDTIISTRGGEMYVSWSDRNNRVYVTGVAEYVFTGTYSAEER